MVLLNVGKPEINSTLAVSFATPLVVISSIRFAFFHCCSAEARHQCAFYEDPRFSCSTVTVNLDPISVCAELGGFFFLMWNAVHLPTLNLTRHCAVLLNRHPACRVRLKAGSHWFEIFFFHILIYCIFYRSILGTTYCLHSGSPAQKCSF